MCRTCISYSKTGSKKRATCFVTFLENELNSDVARCTIHALINNQQIRLQGFISWVGCKVAKKVASFLFTRLTVPLPNG